MTLARLEVIVKDETNPQNLPALGKNTFPFLATFNILPTYYGGVDYSQTEVSLVFERSTENQTKCGEFSIIQDGLEGQETFILSLSQDNDIYIQASITVNINTCKQGGKF